MIFYSPSDQWARGRPSLLSGLFALSLVIFSASDAAAAKLHLHTLQDWERYLEWADHKVQSEISDPAVFLYQSTLDSREQADVRQKLKAGKAVIRKVSGIVPKGVKFDLKDGAIHHWWGAILVPDLSLERLLAFLKDYDNHSERFLEVERSRLISRNQETYRFYFRLRRSKAPVTVYYNTEQTCTYYTHGTHRASSRSHATKIAELSDPGTPGEKERSSDDDWGFLWRLVTWWRFQETPEGVIVECESASLSRSVPGWLRFIPGAMGYLESVPRESIENTLTGIREHAGQWNKPE